MESCYFVKSSHRNWFATFLCVILISDAVLLPLHFRYAGQSSLPVCLAMAVNLAAYLFYAGCAGCGMYLAEDRIFLRGVGRARTIEWTQIKGIKVAKTAPMRMSAAGEQHGKARYTMFLLSKTLPEMQPYETDVTFAMDFQPYILGAFVYDSYAVKRIQEHMNR